MPHARERDIAAYSDMRAARRAGISFPARLKNRENRNGKSDTENRQCEKNRKLSEKERAGGYVLCGGGARAGGKKADYRYQSPSAETLAKQREETADYPYLFSIVVPAYETKVAYLAGNDPPLCRHRAMPGGNW